MQDTDTTQDTNTNSAFHEISLDDGAPNLDFSFGGTDSKSKDTGGGGFGTWGKTWDFSNIGTAATTDSKDDKSAKGGKDKDSKDGTSDFGDNNPWSLGNKSKASKKKTMSNGFDFGDFGAIDESNDLSLGGGVGASDSKAADDGWGFASINKKDKKKKGKNAIAEEPVPEAVVEVVPEFEKVEEDTWSAWGTKKDKKKGKKGVVEEDIPPVPPPPPPAP